MLEFIWLIFDLLMIYLVFALYRCGIFMFVKKVFSWIVFIHIQKFCLININVQINCSLKPKFETIWSNSFLSKCHLTSFVQFLSG